MLIRIGYPREIEIALESHPLIRAAAVLGVEDDEWGQVGHAFVEPVSSVSPDDIRAWCRDKLANYKVPKRITLLEAMPRTSVDKVDRMALTKRIGG